MGSEAKMGQDLSSDELKQCSNDLNTSYIPSIPVNGSANATRGYSNTEVKTGLQSESGLKVPVLVDSLKA